MTVTNTDTLAKDVVNTFLKAMNEEDYRTARSYTTDDFIFIGVMGTRNGADAYFKDMEHMRFKYDIKKMVAEGDDVCVLYDIQMGDKTIFTTGWYTVKDGQITNLIVLFDPRPLLEKKPQQ